MLVVQLSDIHILRRPDSGKAMFADNASRLQRTIEFIRQLVPVPDVAIISGDLSHEGDLFDYSYCRLLLERLPCPFFVVPGNHDYRNFVRETFPLNGHYADRNFYQFECDLFPLRIIGIDTLENGKTGGELCLDRLDWIEAALSRSLRPTLITMHHPPYHFGMMDNADMACTRGMDRLDALIRAHGNIVGLICGHLHVATARDWAGVRAMTVPSVAPGFALEIGSGQLVGWQNSSPSVGLHFFRNGGITSHIVQVDDKSTFVPLTI